MSLTMEMVLQDPPHFFPATNCYFHHSSVCCMTDAHYRWMRWEGQKAIVSDPDLNGSQVRMFGSDDQGVTWDLLAEFDVPLRTQWSFDTFSPGGERLLAGIFDKTTSAYDASFSVLPRSEDRGLTWVSAVSQDFYDSLTFQAQTTCFVKLPNTTTVLAFGQYEVAGVPYNVLRSTDDGLTFTAFSSVGEFIIFNAVALSSTVVVASATASAYYSTDGGATWTQATKPGSTVVGEPISMGSGVVLTAGRDATAHGAVLRSLDSGQTYSILASFPTMNALYTIRALTTTHLVVGGDTVNPGDLITWWLSEDAGDTWAEATALVGDRFAASLTASLTITTTGIVLADLDRKPTSAVAAERLSEIWRGTVEGLVSTGIGTCEAAPTVPPIAAGLLGTHLLCIPILSPAPCPQLCPVDPVQPEGVLVLPTAPEGGGWFDLLGVVELVDGSVVPVVPAVTLGHPAGCGATFANNYCAVAGV
jgi:hypothetical protein